MLEGPRPEVFAKRVGPEAGSIRIRRAITAWNTSQNWYVVGGTASSCFVQACVLGNIRETPRCDHHKNRHDGGLEDRRDLLHELRYEQHDGIRHE